MAGGVLTVVSPYDAVAVLYQDFLQVGTRILVVLYHQYKMAGLITRKMRRHVAWARISRHVDTDICRLRRLGGLGGLLGAD